MNKCLLGRRTHRKTSLFVLEYKCLHSHPFLTVTLYFSVCPLLCCRQTSSKNFMFFSSHFLYLFNLALLLIFIYKKMSGIYSIQNLTASYLLTQYEKIRTVGYWCDVLLWSLLFLILIGQVIIWNKNSYYFFCLQNSGQVAPLNEIIKLKEKYMCPLLMDESNSFGVLGEFGRGLTEHCGVPVCTPILRFNCFFHLHIIPIVTCLQVEKIDIITGAMGHALAAEGGFCTGNLRDIEHQVWWFYYNQSFACHILWSCSCAQLHFQVWLLWHDNKSFAHFNSSG